jgi:OST-HTH/LOTUS domain
MSSSGLACVFLLSLRVSFQGAVNRVEGIGPQAKSRPRKGLAFDGMERRIGHAERVIMADLVDDDAKALQRDVQRLLGRCLLRLQQYERLLKAMIAEHKFAGAAHDLAKGRKKRADSVSRQTLGTLFKELVGSFLVSEASDTSPDVTTDSGPGPSTVSMKVEVRLTEQALSQTADDLRVLLDLRNNLVHHFIEQHDLGTADGCRQAQAALVAADEQIDQSYGRLVEWAKDMDQATQQVRDFAQSPAFRDLVIHGIAPDGTVDWPASSLVSGFREAAQALAGDGPEWVSVADAGKWLVEKYPDQSPSRFGCKTWQQALQESRLFDLRHDQKGGRRRICFRERANPKLTDAPERTWEFDGNGTMVQKT